MQMALFLSMSYMYRLYDCASRLYYKARGQGPERLDLFHKWSECLSDSTANLRIIVADSTMSNKADNNDAETDDQSNRNSGENSSSSSSSGLLPESGIMGSIPLPIPVGNR
jgi:hypothetical protein